MKHPVFSSNLYADLARLTVTGLAAGVLTAAVLAVSVLALADAGATAELFAQAACVETGACDR